MKSLRNAWFSLIFATSLFLAGCATHPSETETSETTPAPAAPSAPTENAAPAESQVEATPAAPVPALVVTAPVPVEQPSTPVKMEEPSPDRPVLGKVVLVNPKQSFVVIQFSQAVPPLQTELTVYRDRVAVGTVRISNPIHPPNASADVVTGAIKRGDQVR